MLTRTQTRTQAINAEDTSIDISSEEVTWVQCDHEECQKWRKLPRTVEIRTASEWYCDMHPDPSQRSCDIPEEKCNISGEKFFTFNWFPAGQLVWAKMTGYPPWPAVVTPDPWSRGDHFSIEADAEGCIYHIEFLGKPRSHIWLPENQVTPFRRHQAPASKPTKRLTLAINEAEAMIDLCEQERLEKCEYRTETSIASATPAASTRIQVNTKPKAKHRQAHRKKSCTRTLLLTSPQEVVPQQQPTCLSITQQSPSELPCPLLQHLCNPSLTSDTMQRVTSLSVVPRPPPNMSNYLRAGGQYNMSTSCNSAAMVTDNLERASVWQQLQTKCSQHVVAKQQQCLECINTPSPKSNQITDPLCSMDSPDNDQIVPSMTGHSTFSHLESNVLNEWKEIENLCNITASTRTIECDLGSVLSEMQNIEEFIQVISEDRGGTLPT